MRSLNGCFGGLFGGGGLMPCDPRVDAIVIRHTLGADLQLAASWLNAWLDANGYPQHREYRRELRMYLIRWRMRDAQRIGK